MTKKIVAKGKEYKGSAANGGRKIIVEHYKDKSGKWHTTSKNAARYKYELPRIILLNHLNE